MVYTKPTGIREFGDWWSIVFTAKEIEFRRCIVCRGVFNASEEIYICNECGKIVHVSCSGVKEREFETPCLHLLDEYSYFRGKVVLDG